MFLDFASCQTLDELEMMTKEIIMATENDTNCIYDQQQDSVDSSDSSSVQRYKNILVLTSPIIPFLQSFIFPSRNFLFH
jgi:hypothetical protein